MRRIVITGATSGIGLETARALVSEKYELILCCRNIEKAEDIWHPIIIKHPEARIRIVPLDLASFESIERCAELLLHDYTSIDVLFNNAGVFMDTAQKTKEGFEMTLGVNYLGNYYFTKRLLVLLKKGAKPQVINMCSKAALYGSFNIREGLFNNHPHGFKAYSESKLMQLMVTLYFAEQLESDGVSVNAIYPGKVATGIWKGESFLMKIMGAINQKRYDSPVKAAKVGLYLIEHEEMWQKTGCFFEVDGQEIRVKKQLIKKEQINHLIQMTESIIGEYERNSNQ